jgi:hypothetical protein
MVGSFGIATIDLRRASACALLIRHIPGRVGAPNSLAEEIGRLP